MACSVKGLIASLLSGYVENQPLHVLCGETSMQYGIVILYGAPCLTTIHE